MRNFAVNVQVYGGLLEVLGRERLLDFVAAEARKSAERIVQEHEAGQNSGEQAAS